MSHNNWYREQLVKSYGHLYQRDYNLDQRKCRYCNDPFYCYDHRPAISQCPNMNMQEYREQGGLFVLLPCCKDCNSYLSNNYFVDILDCLFFLMDRYRTKLFKFPVWTEAEIETLGDSLKGSVILGQVQRNLIVDKIENIRCNIITYQHK